jgi:4'-phosphopantetheinyl transferase
VAARAETGSPALYGAWPAVRARALPGPGAAHVWRAALSCVPDRARGVLSGRERERAARFPRRGDGRRWAGSRVALRVLLGLYLDADPAGLDLLRSRDGRLSLAASGGVAFSLSHSGPLAVFAFTGGAPVGVDVETGRRPFDEIALARRLMGPDGAARIGALEPALRRHELLREWARREALLKCGQALAPWVIDFDVERAPAALAVACENAPAVSCWTLC